MFLKFISYAIWIIAAILFLTLLIENRAHAGGLDGAMMGTFAWELDRQMWTGQPKVRQKKSSRKFSYKLSQQDVSDENRIPRFSTTSQKTKSKKTTYKTASNCDGNPTTWTVPDGTTAVQVSLLNSDGGLQSSYTISNYITIKPKQKLRIKAKC